MIVLLLPISLLGLLLVTTILFSITGVVAPHCAPHSKQPLSPIARFHLAEWTLNSDVQVLAPFTVSLSPQPLPLRLKLYWDDNSMTEAQDPKSCVVEASIVPTARSMKRFSVQLPPSGTKDRSRALSTGSDQTSPKDIPDKIDPINFLVALAAQERRVLELKEELQKAETDLTKLKKQWAYHEAIRKRQEIRQQAEPMRPLKTSNEDSAIARESRSFDLQTRRRPAALKTKQTHRKVFEGGRHTRALSLLSPTSLANRGSVIDEGNPATKNSTALKVPMTAMPRIATSSKDQDTTLDSSKEDIVTTGKQIMGDIKDGLWTFIEDLRQAAVGDEARISQLDVATLTPVQQRAIRKAGDRLDRDLPQISPTKLSASKDASHFKEQALSHETDRGNPDSSGVSNSIVNGSDDEGWDNWDSPPTKSFTSRVNSPTQSTPRTSMSSDTKRQSASLDQIPWPVLQKLPGNLTRTASNLMKEWEKSLHSPVEGNGKE